MSAGDVDPVGGGSAHQWEAVRRHGPGTHPFVPPVGEVHAAEQPVDLVEHRLDSPPARRLIGPEELHRPGDPETPLVRGAREALRGEVDRMRDRLVGGNRERVPPARLDPHRHPERAGELRHPGAGRDDHGIGGQTLAGVEDDPGRTAGHRRGHLGHLVTGAHRGPSRANRLAERLHERPGFDVSLPIHPVGRRDRVRQDGRQCAGAGLVEPGHLDLQAVAAHPPDLVEILPGLCLLGEPDDERPLVRRRPDTSAGQLVERLERESVDRSQGCHGPVPGPHGPVGDEPREKPHQCGIPPQRHVQRGVRVDQRPGPVGPQARICQWDRLGRGEIAGVSPRGARRHTLPVDHGHVDAVFLQMPGRRQSHHPRTDHDRRRHFHAPHHVTPRYLQHARRRAD